jgi:hypothetical protein
MRGDVLGVAAFALACVLAMAPEVEGKVPACAALLLVACASLGWAILSGRR